MHDDPLDGSDPAPIPRPEARRFAAQRHDLLSEVRDPEFPVAMRGYDRDAVDRYVMRVNQAIAELEASASPDAAVRRALDRVTEETRGILERAHETSEEIAARSRAQADDRLQRAEREAAQAIADAEARMAELDKDAEAVWQERQRLIDDARLVATELLAVADAALERYPVERPEGLPPGQLTEQAAAESTVELPEQPFDVEAAEREAVEQESLRREPFVPEPEPEPPAAAQEELPPPDPADAASLDGGDELPPEPR